eukprot:5445472-Prymnesium_polylepis.1
MSAYSCCPMWLAIQPFPSVAVTFRTTQPVLERASRKLTCIATRVSFVTCQSARTRPSRGQRPSVARQSKSEREALGDHWEASIHHGSG